MTGSHRVGCWDHVAWLHMHAVLGGLVQQLSIVELTTVSSGDMFRCIMSSTAVCDQVWEQPLPNTLPNCSTNLSLAAYTGNV